MEEVVASLGSSNLMPCPYGYSTTTQAPHWKPGYTYPMSGISFTIESDGSITVNGTATADITKDIISYRQQYTLQSATYTLCGNASASGISIQPYRFPNIEGSTTMYSVASAIDASLAGGESFAWSSRVSRYDQFFVIRMTIASGTTFSNAVFKPMLETGSEAHEWASPVYTTTSKIVASESSIRQNANSIAAKVSVGNVAAQLTLECTDGTSTVNLGADRVTINSTAFKLAAGGNVTSSGQFTSKSVLSPSQWPVSGKMPNKSVLDAGGLDLYVGTSGATDATTRIAQYGPAFDGSITASSPTQIGCGINTKSGAFAGIFAGNNFVRVLPATSGNNQVEIQGNVKLNNGAIYFPALNGTVPYLMTGRYGGYFGLMTGGLNVSGSLLVYGASYKNKIMETQHYGMLAMNAMESTYCVFSDLGSGVIDDENVCYVMIDPDFAETVNLDHDYQVFITQTSDGSISWIEKNRDYFIVHGEHGTTFDWILYARQKGFTEDRMCNYECDFSTAQERVLNTEFDESNNDNYVEAEESILHMQIIETDYDALAEQYMAQYESEIEDI